MPNSTASHPMKNRFSPYVLTLALAALTSVPALAGPPAGPIKVAVRQANGRYELLRAGQPYFVKGAGGGQYPERIAAYGGNSVRTWSTDEAPKVLAEANKHHLTVMLGLDVARERHGFDYNDPAAVAAQLQKIKQEVLMYKDDPAVLFWGIGNELNLDYTNPKVWDAVNDIAKMIHETDPNHPTSTVLAGANKKEVEYVKTRCPAVDILSINTYAGLATLPQQVADAGWTGPYLVAEWGPTGHWEGPQTAWKASVEETSSQKAAVYKSRYEASIEKDRAHCLGSYVFLWGQKQERTPTWYGIFTEKGEETEVVDVIQYLWTGHYPKNRAPHISTLTLDGKPATASVTLRPGQPYPLAAAVTDPEHDALTYQWELLPESTDLKQGGDRESRPTPVAGRVPAGATGQTTLTAPTAPGAYRLFVYAHDGHGNVATGNIPFLVPN
ncbi:glycoside hydrolase family 2 TIM barrel-domain containing protein [Hymenobacter sp. H14-R3]|uniref:glycoside hydrolase family 2 TIM barrel-domain containing protein n=1 Tax=Hymenobacter sp. H14-R3 TaxID=3046308 RepID=UPI0024BB3A50|nr:glycoside hydrolase family 2 TIM barrel-domain containing protein [Hymenobacter sp. H14-R3]MDJ0364931.1 glycoside hydrolase family 2 TIM barrel-domain containing protein [Hymenobacter sp. H14-R3]